MFSNSSNPSLVGLLMVYALALCESMTSLSLSSANFETKLVSMERIYTFMNIEPEPDYKRYCEEWKPQEEIGKQVFKRGAM
jgi:ABC-type multidrug transport system fused ATPase/permease subunit